MIRTKDEPIHHIFTPSLKQLREFSGVSSSTFTHLEGLRDEILGERTDRLFRFDDVSIQLKSHPDFPHIFIFYNYPFLNERFRLLKERGDTYSLIEMQMSNSNADQKNLSLRVSGPLLNSFPYIPRIEVADGPYLGSPNIGSWEFHMSPFTDNYSVHGYAAENVKIKPRAGREDLNYAAKAFNAAYHTLTYLQSVAK